MFDSAAMRAANGEMINLPVFGEGDIAPLASFEDSGFCVAWVVGAVVLSEGNAVAVVSCCAGVGCASALPT